MAAMSQQPPDDRPSGSDLSGSSVTPMPWTRRYRLFLQLGGLATLAGVLVVLILLTLWEDDPLTAEEQGAADRVYQNSIRGLLEFLQDVPPADLPESYMPGPGFAFGLTLSEANLGAASEYPDPITFSSFGWTDQAEAVASGMMLDREGDLDRVADAMRALRAATGQQVVDYVGPHRNVVDFIVLPDPGIGQESLHVQVRHREAAADLDALPDIITDVIWVREGRSLLFVARNAFVEDGVGPPLGGLAQEIDLIAWAGAVQRAYGVAEELQAVLEEARREASGA